MDIYRCAAASLATVPTMRFDHTPSAARRRLVRLACAAPVVLVLWGMTYVRVSEWLDERRFPRIGAAVDVGGRTLNLSCAGSGSPTVVFESGFGQPGYSWLPVQREVSKTHRACWYDRAGYGWSDPAPGPRWSDSVAIDLHRVLVAGNVRPPYVLVGHSIGGFHVRLFNARFPGEVAGLVLVDPSNEDVATRIPDMPRARPPQLPAALVHTVDAITRQTGLWRWFMRAPGPKPAVLADRDWRVIASLRRSRKMLFAESQETPESASADIARRADHLDSVPLIVLTRGKPFPLPDSARAHRLLSEWIALSSELAHRSSRGKQIVVEGAGHFIQYDQPAAVVNAIREVADSTHTSGVNGTHAPRD